MFLNQRDAWLMAEHNPAARTLVADRTQARGGHGLFIAEGVLVVEQLLASAFGVRSILVSTRRAPGVERVLAMADDSTPIYCAKQGVMDAIVGFPIHRGLLACGERVKPEDPIALARRSRALVVLEDLSNHDNVGSVFRSAAALGGAGTGVLLSKRCCDPLYRKSLRVSMGHALRIPFARFEHIDGLLGALREEGFTSIATTPDQKAITIDESLADRPEKPALLLGAEGPGLSRAAISAADQRVRIAIANDVDSLNIAVAAAVCMHRYFEPARHAGS